MSSWEGGWTGRDHGESYVWMDVGVKHGYLHVELHQQAPPQDGMTELGSHRQAFPGPTALSVRGSGLTRVEQPTDSK